MEVTDVRPVPLSHRIPEERQHSTDLGTAVKNEITLVVVETDADISGYGVSLGTPPVIEGIIESSLAPMIIGEDPLYTEKLWEKMYNGPRWKTSLERGYSQPRYDRRGLTLEAISGIDIALWDLKGKYFDEPIYKLLGASRDSIRGYASGGWGGEGEIGDELQGYVEKGFDAVKMRVVGDDGYGLDKAVNRIHEAREAIGDDVELMIDAHGSLDEKTAIKIANRIEPCNIAWFEEPTSPDDHAAAAAVRAATEIPIAAGESEFNRFDILSLLQRDAIDIVQPDVARAGGITESRRIAATASSFGVRFAPHAWYNAILYAASIHLAMAMPNCHVLECSQARYMPLFFEFFEEPFDIRDGRVHAPDRPGLGFTLRDDLEEVFEYQPGPNYIQE